MAHVNTVREFDLDSPWLVEGLPGAGLVGKIACDHLVEQFEMEYVAGIHCSGLPKVAVYRGEDSTVRPPVRIYADETRDLLVLQSDIPVSPSSAGDFSGCITNFVLEHDATPIYISGLDEERTGVPEVYGVGVGRGTDLVAEAGIVPPREGGLVSGPTGALLATAEERDVDAVGLVAQTDAKFPDPEASRAVLRGGVAPLTGVEVETDSLVEHAEEIRKAREQLAERLQNADDESSRAQPIRGFQ
ncbi:PAC2 family protein [Salinirubellus salinus]|uniref:PAC2 family protein n=1 Tax=Salinirubellus salinus TaxID=1364945 RepID=A0A9E7R4I7_9EURY|nr:PAC2 family protein [Salinirubellus salinus]UWM55649.1 PAC2 family protein [Salinirubellus salinus]